MRRHALIFLTGIPLLLAGCSGSSAPVDLASIEAPVAKTVAKELEIHGRTRIDPYYWLNERENPEVVSYLEAENAYLDEVMGHTEDFRQELFDEMVGRIKQNDESVPYLLDGYYYYTRYVEGGEYPLYCRKKSSLEADEEVMLDVNAMAEGHEYYAVRGTNVSSGQDILAYAVDTVGRRKYTVRFKNLTTGEDLPDTIADVTGNTAWAEDNKTLLYTRQDPQTLRWHQIWRHTLGTDPADDVLVYEEQDEEFSSFVFKTKSKRYLMIGSSQTQSSEYRFLDATDPAGKPKVVLKREDDHEYNVDHFGDHFFIKTNWQAKNFRLMQAPVDRPGDKQGWVDVIPHRDDVLLENFEIFKDHLVVMERKAGLIQLRVRPWSGEGEHYIDFGEPAYLAYISTNPSFDTTLLRYGYTSLTTPRSIFDYDMNDREKTLMKQDEVLGGFDQALYKTERLWAPARDGKRIPVSLVYREGFEKNGSHPLLLYGYGSYGATIDASFRSDRLSLIDRGFVFAIAHIRGSETLGREWYEDGKLLNKKNTFTDFIDAADYLIAEKYGDPERLFAYGGSAGGLLMGAITNMRPDLWKGVVAAVPFVDVVTTMLDDSIPLTTSEYDEWGNPNDPAYYEYILSYSPYDNVEAKEYPNLLVTTGLHDSQVQYWEPAKWVAKLRAMKTDGNRLLLHTNLEAGHSGTTGRFKRYEQTALVYAFMLDLAGIHG
jgi:oligopeptidase B